MCGEMLNEDKKNTTRNLYKTVKNMKNREHFDPYFHTSSSAAKRHIGPTEFPAMNLYFGRAFQSL
jgi:hypothetical protein